MTEEQIKRYTYTKEEINMLVQAAVAEAREMDTILMAKHNRNATIISMILGLICLALFLDGLLRILGIIPPFMDLDVNVIDDIIERVERDVIPQLQKYQRYIPGI
jgi:hypothetical protein|tara:strand:+ start:287 stop:601 length:315 start_codon:yes stop_codon:yes gene_type:complete